MNADAKGSNSRPADGLPAPRFGRALQWPAADQNVERPLFEPGYFRFGSGPETQKLCKQTFHPATPASIVYRSPAAAVADERTSAVGTMTVRA